MGRIGVSTSRSPTVAYPIFGPQTEQVCAGTAPRSRRGVSRWLPGVHRGVRLYSEDIGRDPAFVTYGYDEKQPYRLRPVSSRLSVREHIGLRAHQNASTAVLSTNEYRPSPEGIALPSYQFVRGMDE